MSAKNDRSFFASIAIQPLLLFALLFLLSPSPSLAAFSFFHRPLKVITCEMMLKGKLNKFSSPQSALPVVRDFRYQVKKAVPDSVNDGINYPELFYSGKLSKMNPELGRQIIERLNGIEENLIETNPDMQMVTFEIRGNDINKALEALERHERELDDTYSQLKIEHFPLLNRLLFTYFNLAILKISFHSIEAISQGLWSFDSNAAIAAAAGVFFLGAWSQHYKKFFEYEKHRFDHHFINLKGALKRVTSKASPEEVFVQSSSITMPIEFHRLLMSQDDRNLEDARLVAVQEFMPSYTQWIFTPNKKTQDWRHQRIVANAGELFRIAMMDHVVYYDTRADEPVWFFSYRAYRQYPAGRKPTKKRQEEPQRELQWQPGLRPIPITVPIQK